MRYYATWRNGLHPRCFIGLGYPRCLIERLTNFPGRIFCSRSVSHAECSDVPPQGMKQSVLTGLRTLCKVFTLRAPFRAGSVVAATIVRTRLVTLVTQDSWVELIRSPVHAFTVRGHVTLRLPVRRFAEIKGARQLSPARHSRVSPKDHTIRCLPVASHHVARGCAPSLSVALRFLQSPQKTSVTCERPLVENAGFGTRVPLQIPIRCEIL